MDFIECEKYARQIVEYSMAATCITISTIGIYALFIHQYVDKLKEKFKDKGLEKRIKNTEISVQK